MLTSEFRFKTAIKYMTKPEAAEFRGLRDRGELSIFRTDPCVRCGREVIKGKLYCSKECYMSQWEAAAVANKLIGAEVEFETKDGSRRRGRLTQVVWSELKVNNQVVKWPKGVVMNNDKLDEIPWSQLAWIKTEAI